MENFRSAILSSRGLLLVLLVCVLLVGLPAAVWLDLRNLTAEHHLSVRIGCSIQESSAAQARRFRGERTRGAAQRSKPATDRRFIVYVP